MRLHCKILRMYNHQQQPMVCLDMFKAKTGFTAFWRINGSQLSMAKIWSSFNWMADFSGCNRDCRFDENNGSVGDIVWVKKMDNLTTMPLPDGRWVERTFIECLTIDPALSSGNYPNWGAGWAWEANDTSHEYFKPNGLYGFADRPNLMKPRWPLQWFTTQMLMMYSAELPTPFI